MDLASLFVGIALGVGGTKLYYLVPEMKAKMLSFMKELNALKQEDLKKLIQEEVEKKQKAESAVKNARKTLEETVAENWEKEHTLRSPGVGSRGGYAVIGDTSIPPGLTKQEIASYARIAVSQ